MKTGKSIAIITARGGSKRIPRKNVKIFNGKPIIEYSIKAALDAGIFDEVIISTDNEEIAEIGKNAGASIPFLRSEANSNDFATTADVLREVLQQYVEKDISYNYFCCIYPTAPFVTAAKLKIAFDKLISMDADSIVPVCRYSFPILRSLKMDEQSFVSMNWKEHLNSRSQDLPPAFHDAGQFYFCKTQSFLRTGKLFSDRTIGMEVRESEVQDIDNEEDWIMAEIKFRFLKEKSLV